jgi:hypothetical protein
LPRSGVKAGNDRHTLCRDRAAFKAWIPQINERV